MKIAVFVDEAERIASFYRTGFVRVYAGEASRWKAVEDVPFAIKPDTTIANVKGAIRQLAIRLDDCKVFVADEARGLVYTVLEAEIGLHTWRSRGEARSQLDEVAMREAERAAAGSCGSVTHNDCMSGCDSCSPRRSFDRAASATHSDVPVIPQQIADGVYRIDLAGALNANMSLNSRQILFPILERHAFASLEIFCDHVPRWFERQIPLWNLRADIDARPDGVTIRVFPNT